MESRFRARPHTRIRGDHIAMITALLSSLASVVTLVLTAGTAHVSAISLGLALALGAVGATLLRRAMGRWSAALMPVAAAGAGIQSRWEMAPGAAVLTLACLLAGMVLTALAFPPTLRLPARVRWILGTVLVVAATAARFILPHLGGDPESGLVDLPGIPPVMSGEIGRALVILGVALALGAMPGLSDQLRTGRHPWRTAAAAGFLLAPASAFLVVCMIEGDSGPLAVTAAILGILFGQAFGWWAAALPSLGALGLGAAYGLSTGEFQARWSDIIHGDAHGQLSLALRSMDVAGWLHLGEPTLARAVPAGDTDYAPATLAAVLGVGPMFAAVAIVLGCGWSLLGTAQRTPRQHQPVLVASAWALLLPTVWIVAGNLGLLPFSGLPAPALAGGGSAGLTLGLLLGAAAGSANRVRSWTRHPLPVLRAASAAMVAVFLAVAVLQAGHVIATGKRVTNEWLYRARGDLLAADGTMLAHTDPQKGRSYPDDPALNELGAYHIYASATGIELTTSGALTCGTHHGTATQLATLGLLDECDPVTVVTTIEPGMQHAAAQAASATAGASILVVDASTGGIVAAANHEGDPSTIFTDNSLPPGSTFKIVTAAAAAAVGLVPPVLGATITFDGETLGNDWDGPCPYPGGIPQATAASCNTTFGWLGANLGADRLAGAAADLGFTGGAVEGPADLSRGSGALADSYATGETGLEVGDLSQAQLARTAIGQESVRATLADMVHVFLTAWTGQRRAFTYTAGTCRRGTLHPWQTTSTPLQSYELSDLRAGLQAAADTGSLKRLGGAVRAGKTGTAQTAFDGRRALASWLVALTADGQYALGIRVAPTPGNLRPSTGNGGAVDVAAELFSAAPTAPASTNPCRP